MNELEIEKNKIKNQSRKIKELPKDKIRKEIKENYKIGIEYFQNIENHDN